MRDVEGEGLAGGGAAAPAFDTDEARVAAARGPLALGLAVAAFLLTFLFAVGCPGLSCVPLAVGVVSLFLAYVGMGHARDNSLHIAALGLGGVATAISFAVTGVVLVFILIYAVFAAIALTV
jgi:hypothetical protein